MHTISEEKLKELLLDKKMTDAHAAVCLGVSKETVRRRRISLNITPKPKHPAGYYELTPEQNILLEEMYKQGLNDYDVAERMNLGRNRLRAWRRSRGIASKSNKKDFNKDDAADMALFVQEGHTLSSIAQKYQARRTSISRCLKRYGYEYAEYRPEHPAWVESYLLTDKQKQVVLGDLLGDGCLVPTSEKSAYMQFGHATDQELFVRWKISVLEPLSSCVTSHLKHNSVSGKTWTSPELRTWYDRFYVNGVKFLCPSAIFSIEALGLAVWYMGDGSINGNTGVFHVGLKVDVPKLVTALNEKFGSLFEYRKYEKEWHIRVTQPDLFFPLVCPHIIAYFQYKVPEKYQHLIEKEHTAQYNLFVTSSEYSEMGPEQREKVLDDLCAYYKKKGFPYPSYGYQKIRKDCLSLRSLDTSDFKTSLKNNAGRRTCNHFMPHRFDCRRYDSDPMCYWKDSEKFRDFMDNRLKYANSTVTDSAVRTGMSLKGIPANFSPVLAKHVYQKYGVREGRVLDFSAGYGGRLLGWMASGIGGSYHGVEPCKKSYDGLRKMALYCTRFFEVDKDSISFTRAPFEDITLEGEYDFIFSSPPFFGLEIYSSEETQSIQRYAEYSTWLQSFWRVLVSRCYNAMKKGSIFVYSVGNYGPYDLVQDTRRIMFDEGYEETAHNFSVSYHNVYANTDKTEAVYVFKK